MSAVHDATVGVLVVGAAVCFLIVVSMAVGGLLKDHPACAPTPAPKAEEKRALPPAPSAPRVGWEGEAVEACDLAVAAVRARVAQKKVRDAVDFRDLMHGRGWVYGLTRLDLVG